MKIHLLELLLLSRPHAWGSKLVIAVIDRAVSQPLSTGSQLNLPSKARSFCQIWRIFPCHVPFDKILQMSFKQAHLCCHTKTNRCPNLLCAKKQALTPNAGFSFIPLQVAIITTDGLRSNHYQHDKHWTKPYIQTALLPCKVITRICVSEASGVLSRACVASVHCRSCGWRFKLKCGYQDSQDRIQSVMWFWPITEFRNTDVNHDISKKNYIC